MWRAYVVIDEVFSRQFVRWATLVLIAFLTLSAAALSWKRVASEDISLWGPGWMLFAFICAVAGVLPLAAGSLAFFWRDLRFRDKALFPQAYVASGGSWLLAILRVSFVAFVLMLFMTTALQVLVYPLALKNVSPALGTAAILVTTVVLGFLLVYLTRRWMAPVEVDIRRRS